MLQTLGRVLMSSVSLKTRFDGYCGSISKSLWGSGSSKARTSDFCKAIGSAGNLWEELIVYTRLFPEGLVAAIACRAYALGHASC